MMASAEEWNERAAKRKERNLRAKKAQRIAWEQLQEIYPEECEYYKRDGKKINGRRLAKRHPGDYEQFRIGAMADLAKGPKREWLEDRLREMEKKIKELENRVEELEGLEEL